MPRFRVFLLIATITLCVHASPRAQSSSGDVVATAAGKAITVADVQAVVTARKIWEQNPDADLAAKSKIVEDIILDHLVEAEARSVSLKDQHRSLLRIKRGLMTPLGELYTREHILPQLAIDSAAIDSFYHARIARYTATRDQRRIRQIMVRAPDRRIPDNYSSYVDPVYDGWDPEDKINAIYERLAAGEDFSALALVHSEDPHSKSVSGELGWVSAQSLPEGPFTDICLTLPVHKITRPFRTEEGWHIVQVTSERPKGPVPVDQEIAIDIVTILTQELGAARLKQVSDSLRESGSIEFSEDGLSIPDDDLEAGTLLAVVNGLDSVFAGEYLADRLHWNQRFNTRNPTPAQRREAVMERYYMSACWRGLYRDYGYFDRPDIRDMVARQEQKAREELVRLRIATTTEHPDSAAVRDYYDSHSEEFANPPRTFQQARHSIRQKLQAQMRGATRKKEIARLEARHGVTRFPKRLTGVILLQRDGT